APCLRCPLPAFTAGRAGARPDHSITGSLASPRYVKGKIAARSFLRHPGPAQALDSPVKGRTDAWIGRGRWCQRLERHDILDFRQRGATLFSVTGLRIMAGQCKRRGESGERTWSKIWIDRDRPARPFDRLIVLLQPKISATFAHIPSCQLVILRTETSCLV